jgi:hypothetical protein
MEHSTLNMRPQQLKFDTETGDQLNSAFIHALYLLSYVSSYLLMMDLSVMWSRKAINDRDDCCESQTATLTLLPFCGCGHVLPHFSSLILSSYC